MPRNSLTAVPAARSSLPLLKWRRRAVIGALLASSAAGLVSFAAWSSSGSNIPAPVALPDSTAVSLAQTVVEDYFGSRKSAVPTASGVTDDFSVAPSLGSPPPAAIKLDSVTFAKSAPWTLGDGTGGYQKTEQETFNVATGGRLLAVTVTMELDSSGSWVLGAAPSIVPAAVGSSGSSDPIDYGHLYTNSSSDASRFGSNADAYVAQIKNWATVFAQAGHASTDLYTITGDHGARTYSGLNGWKLVGDPVVKSVSPVSTPSPGFIVRVSLVLAPPAANGPNLSTDYDLYVLSDKVQGMSVAAWGAPGSYKSLAPYVNADQQ